LPQTTVSRKNIWPLHIDSLGVRHLAGLRRRPGPHPTRGASRAAPRRLGPSSRTPGPYRPGAFDRPHPSFRRIVAIRPPFRPTFSPSPAAAAAGGGGGGGGGGGTLGPAEAGLEEAKAPAARPMRLEVRACWPAGSAGAFRWSEALRAEMVRWVGRRSRRGRGRIQTRSGQRHNCERPETQWRAARDTMASGQRHDGERSETRWRAVRDTMASGQRHNGERSETQW
jgi:hypothetical protein